MRLEISRLHKKLGITTVYVTHDQIEAMTLADRIVVLDEGVIMQAGSPRELYNRPMNKFVAEFIGSPKMNMMPCEVKDGRVTLRSAAVLGVSPPASTATVAWLGVRPENIMPVTADEAAMVGTLVACEYLGSEQFAYIDCGFDDMITMRVDPELQLETGVRIGIDLHPDHLHFFDKDGKRV